MMSCLSPWSAMVFAPDCRRRLARSSPVHLLLLRAGDQLAGLLIERTGAVLHLTERRRRGPRPQHVDAGIDAFGLLYGDAIAVACADEVRDDLGAVRVDAERDERVASEAHRGFERLAQFIVDAL